MIRFDRKELLNAIKTVEGALSGRNTLPILSHILIIPKTGSVQVTATNLTSAIQCEIEAEILDEIKPFCVPGKKFISIISSLEDDVTLQMPGTKAIIQSGNARFSVLCMEPDEYPSLPQIATENEIPAADLKDALSYVMPAMSKDESRHFLGGVYFDWQDDLKIVATDGRRLHHAKIDVKAITPFNCIVPAEAVSLAIRILQGETLRIGLQDNQIIFQDGTTSLISRLIEGEYPDWQAILAPSRNNSIIWEVDPKALINALNRIGILANPKTPSCIMNMNNVTRLTCSTPEMGEAVETLEGKYEGDPFDISMNINFLKDAITGNNLEITLKFNGGLNPVLLVGKHEAVLMPMRL